MRAMLFEDSVPLGLLSSDVRFDIPCLSLAQQSFSSLQRCICNRVICGGRDASLIRVRLALRHADKVARD